MSFAYGSLNGITRGGSEIGSIKSYAGLNISGHSSTISTDNDLIFHTGGGSSLSLNALLERLAEMESRIEDLEAMRDFNG